MLLRCMFIAIGASAASMESGNNILTLDLCRTLLEEEMCDRTMPVLDEHYPVTRLDDKLVVRVNTAPRPHYGVHSRFLPYNCHVLRIGESTTEENAFVLAGCPHKANVAIYQSKVPVRIQFTMQDVLSEFLSQTSGNYTIKCVIGECSRKEGSTINKCPDYDHCERRETWNPDLLYVSIQQLPAYIKLRHYPMYRSAHRH